MKAEFLSYIGKAYAQCMKQCFAAMLFLLALNSHAQQNPSREYQVKAVFLYNFTRFIDWPSASFKSADAPFIIGVLGDDPFGAMLDEAVEGEHVKGHAIKVQRYKLAQDMEPCHLLFLNTREELNIINEKIARLQPNLLTVSDGADQNAAGGMIRLVNRNGKIKVRINPAAVKAADLTISSKLLNVAELVNGS